MSMDAEGTWIWSEMLNPTRVVVVSCLRGTQIYGVKGVHGPLLACYCAIYSWDSPNDKGAQGVVY